MEIVLASGNPGKLREMRDLLPKFDLQPQSEFTSVNVEETGLTFVENAVLKARHACRVSGMPSVADDSGLEVDALRGAPGIHSSRYAGEHATDQDNLEKMLAALEGVTDRSARFRCVIVFMRHSEDPFPLICDGTWEGQITLSPRGESGFGYDPIFLVSDLGRTAAELSAKEKNALSHRGQALRRLKQALSSGTRTKNT